MDAGRLLKTDLVSFGRRTCFGLVCATAFILPALALNPAYQITQYVHTSWGIGAGLQSVRQVKQSPDGYLWLATRGGLVRFDGVRFSTFSASSDKGLESSTMQEIVIDPDGSMWVASLGGGLVHYQAGVFRSYTSHDGLPSDDINAIYRDSHDVLWIGTRGGAIARMVGSHFENVSLGIPAGRIDAFLEDADQSLWIATFGNGVFRLKNGKVSSFSVKDGLPDAHVIDLYRDRTGKIWTVGGNGISYWNGNAFVSLRAVNAVVSVAIRCTEDRDGNFWIASSSGLVRMHDGEVSKMDRSQGLSSDSIEDIFEDREGNIWVGTRAGLDRLSDSAMRTFGTREGLFNNPQAIVADRVGGVWTVSGHQVARIFANKLSIWPITLPAGSIPLSMLSDDGSGFFVGFDGGIRQWNRERVDTGTEMAGVEVRSLLRARNGDIWIGTARRGLLRWRPLLESGARTETVVPHASIYTLAEDHAGVIWAGSADGGGLYRVAGQDVQHYGAKEGLRSPNVYTVFVDRNGDLWIGSIGGLSWFQQGQIRTVNSQQGLPSDQVFSMLDDGYDRLWLVTFGGIASIEKKNLAEWAAGQRRRVNPTVYRSSEGYQAQFLPFPNAVRSTDGHLWFSLGQAVAEVTPTPPTSRAPDFPVLIEDIGIDGVVHSEQGRIQIPPGARSVQLRYTALKLSNPETLRFRYRLEGIDNDWVNADTRRLAFYNNLKPGAYTFRVDATAGEEQWRESSVLVLEQLPFFYQTWWFTLIASASVLCLVFSVYRFRLRQAVHRVQAGFQQRIDERTRIARDLHDTLLQSFQGLLFEFQAARNLFSRHPEEAIRTLDGAIGSAEAAIVEGRDAIQNLRAVSSVHSDLANLLTVAGKELSDSQRSNGNGTAFRLTVEGPPQSLSPVVQDEVYRIGREVLGNAFRHARAGKIEVEIRYDNRILRLRIRDDGIGIDPKVLSEGARPGHWGLPGVRERAKLVGGKLDLWSEAGAGTEIQIAVPASVAYLKSPDARVFGLFRKMIRPHAK